MFGGSEPIKVSSRSKKGRPGIPERTDRSRDATSKEGHLGYAHGTQTLSSQELSVLDLVSSGLTTKELASRLGMSVNTAKYHLSGVYRKLRVRNRVEAMNAYSRLPQESPGKGLRQILELGTRLAAQMASVVVGSRAAYFLIDGEFVRPLIELDPLGTSGGNGFPLAENHHFAEIVSTRQPRISVVATRPLGPHARSSVMTVGVTGGAGVPIVIGDRVHGVLAVGMRGTEVPIELFRRLVDLGRLLELAIENA